MNYWVWSQWIMQLCSLKNSNPVTNELIWLIFFLLSCHTRMYSRPPIFKSNCTLFSWVKGSFHSDLYMENDHSDNGSTPLSTLLERILRSREGKFLPVINTQWAAECGSESAPRWIFSHTVSSVFSNPSTRSRGLILNFLFGLCLPHNIMDFKGKSDTYATWLSVIYLWSPDLFSLSLFFPPSLCSPLRRISLKFV